MKRALLTLALIGAFLMDASAQSNKTFFLGHSLVNFHMPNMVSKLSVDGSRTFSYNANVGNGANLLFHWNNPTSGQGDQWNTTLPLGGFENFILTEAVPLLGQLQWSSTYRIADSLYQFAEQYNPNIRYYIYETWHCTNSGNGTTTGEGGYPCDWDAESTTPWRQRLDIDLPKWESIADSINLLHPNAMLVIPAGQAMARLTDSIAAGSVPGLSAMTDLFSDNIHMDLRGNYFIACVMYSVIHGVSPEGLTNQLTDEWGGLYTEYPTPAQAAKMQQIAWATVCDYARDGVECGITSIDDNAIDAEDITVYPNPANADITIKGADKIDAIGIYTIMGEHVQQSVGTDTTIKVDVSHLAKGVYYLQISSGQSVVNKKVVID